MRWTILVPSWIIAASLMCPSPVQAQTDDSTLSMQRIRTALEQPPPLLRVPASSGDTPTFRVEVQERLFVLRPIDEKPSDPTLGLPSVGELLMDGIEKIRSTAVHYKRGRAERRARKEVDEALMTFCAARECPTPKTGK